MACQTLNNKQNILNFSSSNYAKIEVHLHVIETKLCIDCLLAIQTSILLKTYI